MSSPPVFPAIEVGLGEQVEIRVHSLAIILRDRSGHVGNAGDRGGRGLIGAEAAANAGTATLESGVGGSVLGRVLLYSDQLFRCPVNCKSSQG